MKCKVCAKEGNFLVYKVKERMLNQGEEFDYFLCESCGTLQRAVVQCDLKKYYSNEYYSFNRTERSNNILLKKLRKLTLMCILKGRIVYPLRQIMWDKFAPYMYLYETNIAFDSSILDVGCGSGEWLRLLGSAGFTNLNGLDLFCSENCTKGIKFIKGDIDSNKLGHYDLITFHHSLEHMEDPQKVLAKTKKLLNTHGQCIIRVPICGGVAWDMYKENWYQIDAPRHYYLFSQEALSEIIDQSGFKIKKIIYDSTEEQFLISEQYQMTNKSLQEIVESCSVLDKKRLKKKCKKVNREGKGDQAIFWLEKIE